MEFWYTEEWTNKVRFSVKVEKQLFSKKSDFQQVDVFKSEELGTFLTLDGLMMVNEKDEFIYHDCIVHTPMCVNPAIKKVLVIGGGDGGTVRELTRYPQIEKIDMVEIDELVVRASQEYLPITASKLEDERVNLYFEDGVAWVANATSGTYDLIIVDSTDPIGPGEGLFTTEFYENCYRILSKDGILVNQNE
ncbi:polyamine aminopropyltransferase, partial [Turicibacter sanguinis]|nr:polyamine aminopropyltransferase [Turicibacter sanguinis]